MAATALRNVAVPQRHSQHLRIRQQFSTTTFVGNLAAIACNCDGGTGQKASEGSVVQEKYYTLSFTKICSTTTGELCLLTAERTAHCVGNGSR